MRTGPAKSVPTVHWLCPNQFTASTSLPTITPHSPIAPSPRGPLTEQQFSSGLPARAWNTISWADALRSPSIGVLYVHHRPLGCCAPSTAFHVEISSSSAARLSPVIRSMSTQSAPHAIVQHVSIAPRSYGFPLAASPDEKPPVLWRSNWAMVHQICSNALLYLSSPVMK